jgi:hypothetical protein
VLDGPRATNVAFVAERAWLVDLLDVIAAGEAAAPERVAAVLARWWSAREERLAAWAMTWDAGAERAALVADLASEPGLAARLASAPAVVRAEGLARLRRAAPFLRRMIEIRAPEVVRAGAAARCRAALDALDPAIAWPATPPPEIGTTTDAITDAAHARGEHSIEVIDLHLFAEHMTRAAHAGRPSVGLGEAFGATPEARRFADDGALGAPPPPAYPGLEWRVLAARCDLAFWASPRVALARTLAVPGAPPRILAFESSGLVTYAMQGDAIGAAVDESLRRAVAGLGPDDALVSFVWLDTDPAGPWIP